MINNKRNKNYSEWYNEIIHKSGLAEFSGIRGFMVIKPYGYSLWEIIKCELDKILKESGHQNIYFPLLISKSIFSKEKKHTNFFSDGCAVVTHSRIKKNNDQLIIDFKSKLKEELVIRPTSESIIWNTYKKWIQSYKDLPILLNQWGNAIRWEMRTKLFIRTSEFLWQEGHTAHSSKNEAIIEVKNILNIYTNFLKDFMAIPVIKGIKPYMDQFHGSENTYCIEALMQDGKSLQIGTTHFLGQNFSKAFHVKFTNHNGKKDYVWSTSWGMSTRLIGGLIMSHSDDKGLIIPPKIAPVQIVIIPIYNNEEKNNSFIEIIVKKLISTLNTNNLRIKYDNRKIFSPGWKFNEYEVKGVPIRIVIGKNEIKEKKIEIFRRDTCKKIYYSLDNNDNLIKFIMDLLNDIQKNIYKKALNRTKQSIVKIDCFKKFKDHINNFGGFILSHWDGTSDTGKIIQKKTEATIRCIPFDYGKEEGKCIYSGKYSPQRVIFSKSY
ncbi:proline--tRNA ligase [Blattabacterium cuenoti]|uniref:proline--tRNA ligase n=1 Tax=Blattabacterium cuenoti TaxID=1653831 RepID=UPI00163B90B7|nr:proline--tRNA ligase [Blattabacterium cuenoti]